MYRTVFKRIIDIAIAFIVLLLTSPIIVLVIFVLFVLNNGRPFFFQERPGLHGKSFIILKFKTMNDKLDINGELLPDSERLTWMGKIVRKLSLDELPQLLNVLKGEMSLVGPRPLLVEYLELYSPHQARRHEVKPGITGWAQVNGRNTLSWQRKFEFDVWYVDRVSFALDLKIIWLTVVKVFRSEGISSEKSATMEKFTGNK